MSYELKMNDTSYNLNLENCEAFFNDETMPLLDLDLEAALQLVAQMAQDSFAVEYYEDDCETCPPTPRSKKRLVPFIEGHFYIFSKNQKLVITSIDANFVAGSFDDLAAQGVVDDSYIMSVVLCPKCGKYQIEVEVCEM